MTQPQVLSEPTRHEAARIRWAGLKDAAALTALYTAARPASPEPREAMLEWLGHGGALILEDAAGRMLCAIRWRERGDGWQVDRIATLPQARGQGYGRWLMTKLEALAIRSNIPTLTLTLDEAQGDLLAYYERMGYRVVDGEAKTDTLTLEKRVGGMWQYKSA